MKDPTGHIMIQKEFYNKFYRNKEMVGTGWAGDYPGGISYYYANKTFSFCLWSK
jgi:hypothetical protein